MNAKNTLLPVQTLLQSSGKLLDISEPVVMGILNATPDSFYNQGKDSRVDELLFLAEKMIKDGAAILDIGGVSTRPGAEVISISEEIKRVLPVVKAIHEKFPETWISCDTFHATVAETVVAAGAHIINDISAGAFDDNMLETVSKLNVPYIAMHIQGTPATMQINPQYEEVVYEVRTALMKVLTHCNKAGIKDVVLDVGFGFGKTVAHNFSLLKHLDSFRILGKPLLVGVSRKSMICKTLQLPPAEALNGTTALHVYALQNGANILRVHDVKEATQAIRLHRQYKSVD